MVLEATTIEEGVALGRIMEDVLTLKKEATPICVIFITGAGNTPGTVKRRLQLRLDTSLFAVRKTLMVEEPTPSVFVFFKIQKDVEDSTLQDSVSFVVKETAETDCSVFETTNEF